LEIDKVAKNRKEGWSIYRGEVAIHCEMFYLGGMRPKCAAAPYLVCQKDPAC